ncbi:phenylalanine--tRNA ligase subunit beta [Helicobacter anatolicus]|uniref:phenylalanine--tRNA ligase subunit beta n=1 Tax=Helicobacter anatolicus TaxID=2905874 RepID=UPI001E558EB0|nr:phenylalanine--tRNA ligase subunit beta [Helicobacter anatolicus]MCE3038631.1 phenylalanine--tRNA ligase subunit beta [Helicobacter anatolicus]
MIVTTHLLKEFIDISHLKIDEICNVLNNIGLEVESVNPLKLPSKVVLGKVLKKSPHPDANKLSVCQVDVGYEVLQIVCGAKNVAENQYVAVALRGAVLEFDSKVLEIGVSKLRGVDSYGMLCSSVELGLVKLNDGIMVLDSSIGELELGKELREYDIFQGYVLEISLTPNRGDCLCVLGIARELKAYFGLKIKKPKEYMSTNQIGVGRKFQVAMKNKIQSSLLYKVIDFEDKILPFCMQFSLTLSNNLKSGILENYLSYITYMTGVVLNAYEADSLSKDQNHTNEILWLNVKEDEDGFDAVYADKKLSNIGIGNVIEQNIDQAKTIIFEASYIDPARVSQLLFKHKNQMRDKDLVYKTMRGSNPDLQMGINFLCLLLSEFNHCFVYDGVQEVKQDFKQKVIRTQFSNIAAIIGCNIDRETMSQILKQLDFSLEIKTNDDSFSIITPCYRHDIETEQDLAEEILRIYGVDNIPALPHFMAEQSKNTPAYQDYINQRKLIQRALSHGFLECIHYLFYQKEKLQQFGFEVLDEEKELLNPITSELNTLRTSLLPALLDTASRNQNFGYKNIKICEIGSVYNHKREESVKIAFVASGLQTREIFPKPKGQKWDFYTFAQVISSIIGEFELVDMQVENFYHPYQSAYVYKNGQKLGVIAKLHPKIAQDMGLQNTFVCELDVSYLNLEHPMFEKFSKLPISQRDLTILINRNIAFGEIRKRLLQSQIRYLKNVYPVDIFDQENGQIALSIRMEISPEDTSLRDEDISWVTQEVLKILENDFGAKLKV